MKKYPLAIQIHCLREDFAENPLRTFKMIKEMGYDGIELNYEHFIKHHTAAELKAALDEAGIPCYSMMLMLEALTPDKREDTLKDIFTLGVKNLVVGAVKFDRLKEEPGYADECIKGMIEMMELVKPYGIRTGYHAHDGDYINKINGVPFYEYVFMNTPDDFLMTVDTGNIMGGGGDPIECIKKFPKRAPIVHVKGYGSELKYLTPVWDSELDWKEFFRVAKEIGGAEIFYIEFGMRGDYTPIVRATLACKWLDQWVNEN